jgi:ubiquinone/menaquinone biosynthesis C-methylase UbiE
VTQGAAAFIGSIPQHYDRYLGPIFFHQYADDLAARLTIIPGMRVLEAACGTGILTERLARRLAGDGALVATDLNEAMIEHAKQKSVAASAVEWQEADATKLPFPDSAFDTVICQFGLMFFADKVAGLREACRVLKPGGRYLFNVWDSFESNTIGKVVHDTVTSFFPEDPPGFYVVPFSLHDTAAITRWLANVGYQSITCEAVSRTGESPNAIAAATGLIEGTPLYGEIMQRRPDVVGDIKATLARNLAAAFGEAPLRCPLRAFVFTATKPR